MRGHGDSEEEEGERESETGGETEWAGRYVCEKTRERLHGRGHRVRSHGPYQAAHLGERLWDQFVVLTLEARHQRERRARHVMVQSHRHTDRHRRERCGRRRVGFEQPRVALGDERLDLIVHVIG
jgi:hypothetical protein